MTTWVAFLGAVNVGGTGVLRMADLRAICGAAGFRSIRTHGASGNVLFDADGTEEVVRDALQYRLEILMGRASGVVLRRQAEVRDILAGNPFPGAEPSRTAVILVDSRPPHDFLLQVCGQGNEELRLGRREIYIHYPDGMARSRLRIQAAREGTARNISTLVRINALIGAAASPA